MGVYALRNLLECDFENKEDLSKINGIGFRLDGKAKLTAPEKVVPQDKMDIDLPGYAWNLLPYKNKPLDLYRSHFGMLSTIMIIELHLLLFILHWDVCLNVNFV